jgi:hypothetical protein
MTARGEIVGASTIIGVQHAFLLAQGLEAW